MQITNTAKPSPESNGASVTDTEIIKLLNLRESKTFIKKRLEQIDSELTTVEEELIARIEAGARIESHHPVSVKTSERRCPSWKDEFISVAGESKARKVIDSTTPTISKSIVISTK